MIKENELRIGNFYEWSNDDEKDLYRIEDAYSLYEKSKIIDELTPLELTPEWLIKFGFEEIVEIIDGVKTFDYYLEKNDFEFNCDWDLDGKLNYLWLSGLSVKIKYVHQLQNLYFALTGEELKQ